MSKIDKEKLNSILDNKILTDLISGNLPYIKERITREKNIEDIKEDLECLDLFYTSIMGLIESYGYKEVHIGHKNMKFITEDGEELYHFENDSEGISYDDDVELEEEE